MQGSDAGYITVSADKARFPIISYQETDSHFIEQASKKLCEGTSIKGSDIRYYYLGNGIYLAKCNEKYYDISTSDVRCLSNESIIDMEEGAELPKSSLASTETYKDIWSCLSGDWSIDKTKGHDGNYSWPITNPNSYESGWSQSVADSCSNMGSEFYSMTQLQSAVSPTASNHCGSTSGTNLTAYWRRREPTLCAKVASTKTGLSVYKKVFKAIYPLMGGAGPVLAEEYEAGIESYFKGKGVSKANATIDAWPTFETDCKAEINAGRAVSTLFGGHNYYAWHWVTTFGYKRYKYGSTWQNYIRIADGWCTNANRYDYVLTNNSRYANNIIKFNVK